MRIITISREFGSGGRELGKRLAEQLGFNYFDREIITEIAKKTELDEHYIDSVLEKGITAYPIHIGQTFAGVSTINHTPIEVLVAQQKILKELAEQGDAVFIGRSADAILKDYNPLNIFVYAEMESKLARCKAKGEVDVNLKDKVLIKSFYLTCPKDVLEQRLIARGEKEVEKRLARFDFEESHKGNFDYVIENINLDETILDALAEIDAYLLNTNFTAHIKGFRIEIEGFGEKVIRYEGC